MPGWKTYWRYPGNSGIPPRFDFTGSQNVKSVTVRYPAPQRLTDESGTTIGYKHDVVFPLDVVKEDAGKPATLRVKIDYGVCSKICEPADSTVELTLGGPGAFADRVTANDATVPEARDAGRQGRAQHQGSAARGQQDRGRRRGARGRGSRPVRRRPNAGLGLARSTRVADAPPGVRRFSFDLDGMPPGTKPDGATLLLTAVSGDQAIEVPFRLD